MIKNIDINVDAGEGFGIEPFILPFISSVNVACGGHAGNKLIMQDVISIAKEYNVRIGAHPGFEDKENFGRLVLDIPMTRLKKSVTNQIQSLVSVSKLNMVEVSYVKAHGALYHLVCKDDKYARMMLEIIKINFPHLKIMGSPNCVLKDLSENNNIGYIAEGFADRVYEDDGSLRDRKLDGSVLKETIKSVEQVLNLVQNKVNTYSGNIIELKVNSICFHGDQVEAVKLIKSSIQELKSRGIEIRS